MNILAIETSCDETAAAVVTDGRTVRSSIVSTQIDIHAVTGGVVPEVAARLQLETIIPVIDQAMAKAKCAWEDIDAIAVTAGPGLMGSLIVGVETAKALAYAKSKPLIAVNHLAGHLYACLQDEEPFRFSYLGLIVSGGHTELVLMRGHHDFELIGSTRDDAAGEAFDKVAKLLGLGYPGGPVITELAKQGDPQAIKFPRAMLDQDNLDFSFSGLKSAVLREISGGKVTKQRKADVAASFQAAVVDTLVKKALRAVRAVKPTAVLLGGGVAANPSLRKDLATALKDEGLPLLCTPTEFATDNAAMIGLAAYYQRDEALQGQDLLRLGADASAALAA